MTDEELRAAATDILATVTKTRHANGIEYSTTYTVPIKWFLKEPYEIAARLLQLLPPADDGEAASIPWMVSEGGWCEHRYMPWAFVNRRVPLALWDSRLNQLLLVDGDGNTFSTVSNATTRGQVRRLDSALGIQSKEPKS